MRTTDTHIFFWGEEFSNWYAVEFDYEDNHFYNTEQAFMWEKARQFSDTEMADLILATPNPRENKKLGRKVRNFDADNWALVSFIFMVSVNYAKYSQNPQLKQLLLDTGDKVLVEASPYDKIWGIGLGVDNDDCLDENKWQGMNLLGKALMVVRKQLKNEEND